MSVDSTGRQRHDVGSEAADQVTEISERIDPALLQAVVEVRVGEAIYTFAAEDVVQVMRDCVVTPVPSALASLLGVTGVRGAVVPVFSLAALTGIGRGQINAREGDGIVEWLLLCRCGAEVVGLACDDVVGFKRLEVVAEFVRVEELLREAR
jgi:chemotaxis signal transduction protein